MPASDATDRPLAASGPSPPAIPDHTLLAPIGSGAYGEVWLARNSLGTLRAIKIVRRADFDDDRPYEREFAGIRRFEPISRSHAGLVDLLQVGRNDAEGWFYYVMELADSIRSQEPEVGSQRKNLVNDAAQPLNSVSGLLSPETYAPDTVASEVKAHGALPLDACLRIARTLASALTELHRHGLVHRASSPRTSSSSPACRSSRTSVS